MSKYKALWEFVQQNKASSFMLTFGEIQNIVGIPLFCNIRKNLQNMVIRSVKYP